MAGEHARGRLLFIGLTGGLGAGKSEALAALERAGAATLSADAVVHELLASEEVRDLVVERFGAGVAPGGAVDRQAVARLVFEREEERAWLEEVLWPRVGEAVGRWRAEVEESRPAPAAAVVEVPLLFEASMEEQFDLTVAVVAGEAMRAARAGGRQHPGAAERSARQLTQEEKAQRADRVIENDGTIEELERRLRRLLPR